MISAKNAAHFLQVEVSPVAALGNPDPPAAEENP